jgi:catechol 2,3-dioxygenase-like lactoylglutathione lyase family enzyme
MQPVLGVPDVAATVAWYRDKLGFHVDFVHGDPPAQARVCADPSYAGPTVQFIIEDCNGSLLSFSAEPGA